MRRTLLPALVAVALFAFGCGNDDPEPPATTAADPPSAERERPAEERRDERDRPGDRIARGVERAAPERPVEDEPDLSPDERTAIAAVRRYVRALDSRDGAAVCGAFSAGALDEVPFPRKRGGCAESVGASLGYRDPRGLPVWEGSRLLGVVAIEIEGETARVVATVLSDFADREEPSIEDDVVYLVRDSGRWLIAKPSAVFYRAIGIADVPPTVLAPP